MMKMFRLVAIAAALVAMPAAAQQTTLTTLPKVLDANGNTQPTTGTVCILTSGAPCPVAGGGSGSQPAASSQSVTPASDGGAFPVKGADANGLPVTAPPVLIGYQDETTALVRYLQGGSPTIDGISPVRAMNARTLGYWFNGSTWSQARGDTAGNGFVVGKGGSSVATGQISVGTTATLIAAARTGRQKIGVTVTTAVQCAFGNSGVTLATGWPLAAVAYASDNWDTAAALYAVCASTATVGYREQF